MKKLLLCALFFMGACNVSDQEKVKTFSEDIRWLIASGDRNIFAELPVFPQYSISDDALSYVFGEGNEPGVGTFISKDKILIKIYGPYFENDNETHSSYSIAYYNPEKLKPDEKGFFSLSEIEKFWGVAFLGTVVTIVDGTVMFHRTPFYYGAHAPWAGDY